MLKANASIATQCRKWILLSLILSGSAVADVSLIGANPAGNAESGLPAWEGGVTSPPPGFDSAQGYKNPFEGDKPLFAVDASNMGEHARVLTPGLQQLLKRFPDYRLPVYPSRRSVAFNEAYYKAAAAEAPQIRLVKEGRALQGQQRSSVPFPQPKSGVEAIWNVIMRRPADTVVSASATFAVDGSNPPKPVVSSEKLAWSPHFSSRNNPADWVFVIAETIKPASMTGDALLVHESTDFVDEQRRSWTVNAGQRRVVRLPELTFDAPAGNSDALRTVDDVAGFNGSPERFEWKLLGKQEMLVPYNSYALTRKSLKYAQIPKPILPDTGLLRYELHRVWVLEARLKPGMRHVYSKRVYYIDEDSWNIVLADQYDSRGELWRTRQMFTFQAYNSPGPYSAGEVLFDFQVRKALYSGFQNEEKPVEFNRKLNPSDFTVDALRRMIR